MLRPFARVLGIFWSNHMLVSMFSFFILFNLAPGLQYISLGGKWGISRTRSDLVHVPQTPATKLLARLIIYDL